MYHSTVSHICITLCVHCPLLDLAASLRDTLEVLKMPTPFFLIWEYMIITQITHGHCNWQNQWNNKSLFRGEVFIFFFLNSKAHVWHLLPVRLVRIMFSGLTHYQFKSVNQDTDETCQWYWYGSALFGIRVSSEWSVDGNYF